MNRFTAIVLLHLYPVLAYLHALVLGNKPRIAHRAAKNRARSLVAVARPQDMIPELYQSTSLSEQIKHLEDNFPNNTVAIWLKEGLYINHFQYQQLDGAGWREIQQHQPPTYQFICGTGFGMAHAIKTPPREFLQLLDEKDPSFLACIEAYGEGLVFFKDAQTCLDALSSSGDTQTRNMLVHGFGRSAYFYKKNLYMSRNHQSQGFSKLMRDLSLPGHLEQIAMSGYALACSLVNHQNPELIALEFERVDPDLKRCFLSGLEAAILAENAIAATTTLLKNIKMYSPTSEQAADWERIVQMADSVKVETNVQNANRRLVKKLEEVAQGWQND